MMWRVVTASQLTRAYIIKISCLNYNWTVSLSLQNFVFCCFKWSIIFLFNFRWSLLQTCAVVWHLWTSPWLAAVCRVSVWTKCWKLRDLMWIKRDLTFWNFKVFPYLFPLLFITFCSVCYNWSLANTEPSLRDTSWILNCEMLFP